MKKLLRITLVCMALLLAACSTSESHEQPDYFRDIVTSLFENTHEVHVYDTAGMEITDRFITDCQEAYDNGDWEWIRERFDGSLERVSEVEVQTLAEEAVTPSPAAEGEEIQSASRIFEKWGAVDGAEGYCRFRVTGIYLYHRDLDTIRETVSVDCAVEERAAYTGGRPGSSKVSGFQNSGWTEGKTACFSAAFDMELCSEGLSEPRLWKVTGLFSVPV